MPQGGRWGSLSPQLTARHTSLWPRAQDMCPRRSASTQGGRQRDTGDREEEHAVQALEVTQTDVWGKAVEKSWPCNLNRDALLQTDYDLTVQLSRPIRARNRTESLSFHNSP